MCLYIEGGSLREGESAGQASDYPTRKIAGWSMKILTDRARREKPL